MEQTNKKFTDHGLIIYRNQIYQTPQLANEAYMMNKFGSEDKPYFWFHDHVYSSIPWTLEPTQTLNELYRDRALRLREKYSYLILMYSGGADSNQALQAFLKNGIHIDEVRSYYPEDICEAYGDNVTRRDDPLGLIGEYYGVVKQFKELIPKYPNTKFVMISNTKDMLDCYDDRFISDYSYRIKPTCVMFPNARQIKEYENVERYIEDAGIKNACVITGDDKPAFKIQNNTISAYFTVAQRSYGTIARLDQNFDIEMFYLHPDNPLIPIKQMHIVRKAIRENPVLYDMLRNYSNTIEKFRESNIFKTLVYPDFNPGIYQKVKPTGADYVYNTFFKEKKIMDIIKEKNDFMRDKYYQDMTREFYAKTVHIHIHSKEYNLGVL